MTAPSAILHDADRDYAWALGDVWLIDRDGAAMRMSRRIVESAERCAVKGEDLRRRLTP